MISKLLVLKWAVEKNLNEHLDIIQKILSLNEANFQIGIIITGPVRQLRTSMEPWSPEQFAIQKLRNLALYLWDT